MSAMKTMGLSVTTPGLVIEIEGDTFAEVIAYMDMTFETLKRVERMLYEVNPDDADESISTAMLAVAALKNTSFVMLSEHIRWASEQGLHFTVEKPGTSTGPSWQ